MKKRNKSWLFPNVKKYHSMIILIKYNNNKEHYLKRSKIIRRNNRKRVYILTNK